MEKPDFFYLTRAKRPKKPIDWNKIYVKRSIDEIIVNIDFSNIYNNFNEKQPLENEIITETYLKSINWNIYNNFIDFCNYLLDKIQKSTKKDEIKKIPLIISNISNYRWSSKNLKNKNIKEKRNEVMQEFKNKKF